jgi:type IV pilus assembly protein PilM
MSQSIVGIDIGRDTIRAVELEGTTRARPAIVRAAVVPIPDGAARSGEVRQVTTAATAFRSLWSTGGFRTKNVVIGMGNHRVIARELTVPRLPIDQIRESLPFQVQDMIPVPVGEALLDFYPSSEEVTEAGPVVHGLLVAAIKESVEANVAAVQQAGLRPVQVDLIPFALSRVMMRGAHATGTLALVDIGATTTHVVISSDGVPKFVRMIPLGGNTLTDAISRKLEISPEQAEIAKRARGLSSAPVSSEKERLTAETIFGGVNELLQGLRNTITYFANTRQGDRIGAVLLSGGASQLPGLATALGEVLRLEVIAFDPLTTVDVSKAALTTISDDPMSMRVALGLALGSEA